MTGTGVDVDGLLHGLARSEFESLQVHACLYARRKGYRLEATARRGVSLVVEADSWAAVLDGLPAWAKEGTTTP